MTTFARHLFLQVTALELEVRLRMVKRGRCKYNDIGVTPFVLRMTLPALLVVFNVTVITAFLGDIFCHLFMTVLA